ncbi:MAG: GNAT family N-acetyltransferase [Paracoccus sp. (in: a-proteobacteria)]|nr:GNAT family N-acetyltransferase [Paracoccus sp. (in: a-proteobacteria)]
MEIIDAGEPHLAAITEIYNHSITHGSAVWHSVEADLESRRRWMEDRQQARFPVIVALDAEGRVAGYGSFGPWRSGDGYRDTVEHSVHVRADAQGRGVGRALLGELILRASEAGKHAMIAGIEAGNEISIQLHARLGFERVGYFPEVGTKFGRRLDLVFMQRPL